MKRLIVMLLFENTLLLGGAVNTVNATLYEKLPEFSEKQVNSVGFTMRRNLQKIRQLVILDARSQGTRATP